MTIKPLLTKSSRVLPLVGSWFVLAAVNAFADRACLSFAPLNIPDNNPAGVTATINVTRTAQIQHMKADLSVTHSWVGDLIVRLKHVDTGTTVTLIDRMGVPASTFGCSGDNLNIVLDDGGAGGSIEALCGSPNVPTSPPSYTPFQPFSAFFGESVSGTWELFVSDNAGPDSGQVNSFCMEWNETDVGIEMITPESVAGAGADLRHTVRITNSGPFDAEVVDFSVMLPANVVLYSIDSPRGDFDVFASGFPFSNMVFGSIDNLLVGETVSWNFDMLSSGLRLGPGPLPDSTILAVNSSNAGAPSEIPNYPLSFNPAVHGDVVTGAVVVANDGQAPVPGATTADACEPLINGGEVNGRVVVVDSIFSPMPGYVGTPPPPPCGLATQVNNAKVAGASAAILVNVTENAVPIFAFPPAPPPAEPIPVLVVGRDFGEMLKAGANVSMSVGPLGVWETFSQAAISSPPDEINSANNFDFGLTVLGVDRDRDGVADAVDLCPDDPAKIAPGVCGCAVAETDSDSDGSPNCVDGCVSDPAKTGAGLCGCGIADSAFDVNVNGILDCNEGAGSVVPQAPRLSQKKGTLFVEMPSIPGAQYVVNYEVRKKGSKKRGKKTLRLSTNLAQIKRLPAGSIVKVSYSLVLPGPSALTSAESATAKARIKARRK